MQDFPQELVDQVIDFVYDDTQVLRTSRLICRAWNVSASAHLFHSLNLVVSNSPPNSPSQCSAGAASLENPGLKKLVQLFDILQSSNNIQSCVREVTLGRTVLLTSQKEADPDGQTTYSRLLAGIFARLRRISDLFFREIDWSNLGGTFQECILNICQTATLQNVAVWNCQFPSIPSILNFLCGCKGIQTLRLTHIRILNLSLNSDAEMSNIVATDLSHQQRNTLQSLTIDSVPIPPKLYTLLGMKGAIDFTQLRRLRLNNVTDAATVRECLERSGKSLEHLDLRTSPFYRKPHDPTTPGPDLSHCPNLQHLRISGLQWTPSLCPAESLSATFANISIPAYPLESLHLFIMVVKPKALLFTQSTSTPMPLSDSLQAPDSLTASSSSLSKDLNYGAWSMLDNILSQPQFSSLKNVHVHLTSLRAGDVNLARLSNVFERLRSRNVEVQCV